MKIYLSKYTKHACADPENFARGDPARLLTTFFVGEGREHPNTTKSGTSSAHQQKLIKMAFAGGPIMAQQ